MKLQDYRPILLIVISVLGIVQLAIASPKPIQIEIETPVVSIRLK